MIISTNMSERLTSAASDAWAWWAETHNEKDEWARGILTVSSLALLVIWYTWSTLHSKSRKPHNLRYPPGPRGLPLVGHLPFLDPQLHTYFANLATTYGPIYKLNLGSKLTVVVTSSSLAKEILRDHDVTFANHDVPSVARVAYGGSDVLWSQYGPEWRMLRRVCVREMLNNASLDAVYALRKREVKRMVNDIHRRTGELVNLREEMFLTIQNVITSMAWGGGGGDEERIARLGTEFREVVGEIIELLGKPNVSDFFPSLSRFDLQGLVRDMKVLFLRFDQVFDAIIEERLRSMEGGGGGGAECKDFLKTLLQLKDEGEAGKVVFTMKHLKALLLDMVMGGTDTTANALEWAMAELMNKPETMTKAQEELDVVVGKNCKVEESHLPKLQYLQAVVKEVLRLRPGVPLMVPHCPTISCNIGGYLIPKGAKVFLNTWAIHRDPSIWDNPLDFNPERFLNKTTYDYTGNDFNYLPFGSGRRICAGIPMAERMLMYGLATLLHLFDWELPKGSKLDLEEKFGIVLKKATPLIVSPTPRSPNAISLYF